MIALARRLDAILMAVLNAIVMITSVSIASLILFLVLARYVLGWSVVGVLELATLSAIWLYMSGAVVAARAREHLVVDFLASYITDPRWKALHSLVVSVIVVGLSLFFLSLANDMVAWSFKRPQTTAALSLPLIIPQSAVVLAAIFCSVYALRDFSISLVQVLQSASSKQTGA